MELSELMRRWSMEIPSREEWEGIRARGHGRWILRQGVLGFGLPIYLGILVLLFLLGSFPREIDPSWWMEMLVALLLTGLGGYIVADRCWHRAEDRFG